MANDCQYPGGKEPNKIEKSDIERYFNETETPEEILERDKALAQKEKAESKVDGELGPDDEDDDDDEDDEEHKNGKTTDEEDYYADEYDWDLSPDEREIGPKPWIEELVRIGLYKFKKIEDFPARLEKLIEDFIIPNACKSNTKRSAESSAWTRFRLFTRL
jgi:hypothetical protein